MKKLITIIICVFLIAIGISQIKVTITQNQENDQSQENNQITKVTTITLNDINYEKLKWTNQIMNYINFVHYPFEPYQKSLMKISSRQNHVLVYYPIIEENIAITNKSKSSEKIINTNIIGRKNIFDKIKSFF